MIDAQAATTAEDLEAKLSQACTTLWLATLSLMTAFMRTPAPAHRYLMARKIAKNFDLLRQQVVFDAGTRASFTRLAVRWDEKAQKLAPRQDKPRGGFGLFKAA